MREPSQIDLLDIISKTFRKSLKWRQNRDMNTIALTPKSSLFIYQNVPALHLLHNAGMVDNSLLYTLQQPTQPPRYSTYLVTPLGQSVLAMLLLGGFLECFVSSSCLLNIVATFSIVTGVISSTLYANKGVFYSMYIGKTGLVIIIVAYIYILCYDNMVLS